MMALQHQNQVLICENEKLRMTVDTLQQRWGEYQPVHPTSTSLLWVRVIVFLRSLGCGGCHPTTWSVHLVLFSSPSSLDQLCVAISWSSQLNQVLARRKVHQVTTVELCTWWHLCIRLKLIIPCSVFLMVLLSQMHTWEVYDLVAKGVFERFVFSMLVQFCFCWIICVSSMGLWWDFVSPTGVMLWKKHHTVVIMKMEKWLWIIWLKMNLLITFFTFIFYITENQKQSCWLISIDTNM